MSEVLSALDPFLADPESGRRVSRELRRALFDGASLVACGDEERVRGFVLALARTWPYPEAHRVTIDDRGPRVLLPEGWRELPGVSVADLVRSALRQDPELIAVSLAPAASIELLLNALFTGHALVVGLPAATAQGVLTLLRDAAPGLAPHSFGLARRVVELGPEGIRFVGTYGEGLERLAWLDGGRYAFAGPEEKSEAPAAERELVRLLGGSNPAPSAAPRPSWLPCTGAAPARTRIGARRVLLPAGEAWPVCGACAEPLAHLLQLDLASLPEPLVRADGLAQLFACTHGCDTALPDSPGLSCRRVTGALVEVESPIAPGRTPPEVGVTGWERRDEDPARDDRTEPPDEAFSRPWRCDKLGGWPAWQQGAEWPACPSCAARMDLLFSFCDASDFLRAGKPGWDEARAELLPGAPHEHVFDPARPVHLPGFFTGDADAFLFRCMAHPDALAFLWQCG